jgi:hypothetical protein
MWDWLTRPWAVHSVTGFAPLNNLRPYRYFGYVPKSGTMQPPSCYISHIPAVVIIISIQQRFILQQQPCTGLSLSHLSRSSEPPALSRLAPRQLRPTPSFPGRLAPVLEALAAPLSLAPSSSTPTGAGLTSPADTPTAMTATPGTPLLAPTVLLALRTALLMVLTTLVLCSRSFT